MAAQQASVTAGLDMKRVIDRALRLLRARGAILGLVGLAVVAPAIIANNLLDDRLKAVHLSSNRFVDGLENWLLLLIGSIALVAIESCVTAWICLVLVVDSDRVESSRLSDLARQTIGRAGPIAAQTTLLYLGVTAGAVALIVPGLLLILAWIVATPALIIEKLSPRQALARSRELTRGCRAQIFGLVLGWFVPLFALEVLIAKAVTGEAKVKQAFAAAPIHLGFIPVMGALSHVVFAAFVASLYVELVTVKEGGIPSRISEVFA